MRRRDAAAEPLRALGDARVHEGHQDQLLLLKQRGTGPQRALFIADHDRRDVRRTISDVGAHPGQPRPKLLGVGGEASPEALIALDHGQNYRDIAAWSGLENPNLIEVGQELRVKPPESGAVVKPVAPAGADVRPVVPSADGLRREPKGGKVPYSEQAWAQAQKPEAPVVPVKADAKAEPRTDARPDAKPDVKPETKPEAKPETADDKGRDAAKPAAAGDDRIEWSWPAGGKVMAGFNDTSSKGIDLSGKPGDPVYAAAAGKVVYAGTGLRGYGKLLIVKHDNAYLSAYAHNQQLLVKEGQSVSKGQKIAELGDTDSDRPKLHFEIRKQGKPVDPARYLAAR